MSPRHCLTAALLGAVLGTAAMPALADERSVDIEIVAVNDITNTAMLAHLLKYDSVMGTLAAPAGGIALADRVRVLLLQRESALGRLPVDDRR